MSLASASPSRAALDTGSIHISTSPLLSPPHSRSCSHRQPMQPPSADSYPLPPARSPSPQHHARAAVTNPSLSSAAHHSPGGRPLTPHRQPHLSPPYLSWQNLATDANTSDRDILGRADGAGAPQEQLSDSSRAATDDTFLFGRETSPPFVYQSFTNTEPHQDSNDDIDASVMQANQCFDRPYYATDYSPLQLQSGQASTSTTQNSDFTIETRYMPVYHYRPDEQRVTQNSSTSLESENTPSTTTMRASDTPVIESTYPPAKRRRLSGLKYQSRSKQETPIQNSSEENLLNDDSELPSALDEGIVDEELTKIDLTETNQIPEELTKPIVDKRIKISAFQCAICMDDVNGLTVTYCGHLFCAHCLDQSLDVESTKGKCPMCRAKIDIKPRDAYTNKTKGFWHLELKLMTASRKGKQKASTIAD